MCDRGVESYVCSMSKGQSSNAADIELIRLLYLSESNDDH